jgi:quinol monooxygenase YgiN
MRRRRRGAPPARRAAGRRIDSRPTTIRYSRLPIPKDLPMIHVLAIITAKPGQRDRILEAFQANAATVRAEDGCLAYDAVVDLRDAIPGFAQFGPDTFVVVERWASMPALQAHGAAPHMKAYGARVREFTANRAIHVLEAA